MPFVLAILIVSFIALLSSASAPPLTEQQRIDLETAADGVDHREQAFYALVESIRAWPGPPTAPPTDPTADGEPIHLTFNEATLIERPQDFRAELFRIEGELLQQTPLAPPYEDVSEWFVRDERSKTPVMVYVVMTDSTPALPDRQRIRIDARFYKTVRFTARDGVSRDYPAFVAQFSPAVAIANASPASQPGARAADMRDRLWIIGGMVAALLIAFAIVRTWIAGKSRAKPAAARAATSRLRNPLPEGESNDVDSGAPLPDDPIEALAELKRRAEG